MPDPIVYKFDTTGLDQPQAPQGAADEGTLQKVWRIATDPIAKTIGAQPALDRLAQPAADDSVPYAMLKGFLSGSLGAITPGHVAAALTLPAAAVDIPAAAGVSALGRALGVGKLAGMAKSMPWISQAAGALGSGAMAAQGAGQTIHDVSDPKASKLQVAEDVLNTGLGALGVRGGIKGMRIANEAKAAASAAAQAGTQPLEAEMNALRQWVKDGNPINEAIIKEKFPTVGADIDKNPGGIRAKEIYGENGKPKPASLMDQAELMRKERLTGEKLGDQNFKQTQNEAAVDIQAKMDEEAQKKAYIADLDKKLYAATQADASLQKLHSDVEDTLGTRFANAMNNKIAQQRAADTQAEQMNRLHGQAIEEDARRTDAGIAQAKAEAQQRKIDELIANRPVVREPGVVGETFRGEGPNQGDARATILHELEEEDKPQAGGTGGGGGDNPNPPVEPDQPGKTKPVRTIKQANNIIAKLGGPTLWKSVRRSDGFHVVPREGSAFPQLQVPTKPEELAQSSDPTAPFRRLPQDINAQRLTPEVRQELEGMAHDIESQPYNARTWDWSPSEEAGVAQGNAAGGKANIIGGNAGSPVTKAILGEAPLNKGKLSEVSQMNDKSHAGVLGDIRKVLTNNDIHNNVAEGAVRLAEKNVATKAQQAAQAAADHEQWLKGLPSDREGISKRLAEINGINTEGLPEGTVKSLTDEYGELLKRQEGLPAELPPEVMSGPVKQVGKGKVTKGAKQAKIDSAKAIPVGGQEEGAKSLEALQDALRGDAPPVGNGGSAKGITAEAGTPLTPEGFGKALSEKAAENPVAELPQQGLTLTSETPEPKQADLIPTSKGKAPRAKKEVAGPLLTPEAEALAKSDNPEAAAQAIQQQAEASDFAKRSAKGKQVKKAQEKAIQQLQDKIAEKQQQRLAEAPPTKPQTDLNPRLVKKGAIPAQATSPIAFTKDMAPEARSLAEEQLANRLGQGVTPDKPLDEKAFEAALAKHASGLEDMSPLDQAGLRYGLAKRLSTGPKGQRLVAEELRSSLGRAAAQAKQSAKVSEDVAEAQRMLKDPSTPSKLKATLKRFLSEQSGGRNPEKGAANLQAMGRLASAGVGGLVGYKADDDPNTKVRNAMIGAGLGLAAPEIAKGIRPAIGSLENKLPGAVQKLSSGLDKVNKFHNSALLSPLSVIKKGAGDIGGLTLAALESAAGGNPERAGNILKQFVTRQGLSNIGANLKSGFYGPDQEAISGLENFSQSLKNPLSYSGRAMGALTKATKGILGEAGFSEPEQQYYTLTAYPTHKLTKSIYEAVKPGLTWSGPGKQTAGSKLLAHMVPFSRIGVNRLERAWEYSPLGATKLLEDPSAANEVIKKAALGMGTMAGTYALTPDNFVKEHPIEASAISSLAGPLGLTVLGTMAAKESGAPHATKALFKGDDSPAKEAFKKMGLASREIARDIPGLRLLEDIEKPEGFIRNYLSGYTNVARPLSLAQDYMTGKDINSNLDLSSKNLSETGRLVNRAVSNVPLLRESLPRKEVKHLTKIKFE